MIKTFLNIIPLIIYFLNKSYFFFFFIERSIQNYRKIKRGITRYLYNIYICRKLLICFLGNEQNFIYFLCAFIFIWSVILFSH